MYDIKYNLPITKKDEWEKETEMGLMFVTYNYSKVEIYRIGYSENHTYFYKHRNEGISIHYIDKFFITNNKPYGYYREIK